MVPFFSQVRHENGFLWNEFTLCPALLSPCIAIFAILAETSVLPASIFDTGTLPSLVTCHRNVTATSCCHIDRGALITMAT